MIYPPRTRGDQGVTEFLHKLDLRLREHGLMWQSVRRDSWMLFYTNNKWEYSYKTH